jgi:hypothetical protein
MQRVNRITDGKEPLGDVVQGTAGSLESLGKRLEDIFQMIPAGKAMLTGHAILRPAQFLVVAKAGKTARLGAMMDALRKNARKKKRVVSDVGPEHEARSFIGGLERGDHFEEIIERKILSGKRAARAIAVGKRGENFGDVIRERTIVQVGAFEDVAHQNVEIKSGGNGQATARFEEGVKEIGVVQNLVAGIFIGEKLDEAVHVTETPTEDTDDELHIRRRELNAAIRLNHLHRHVHFAHDWPRVARPSGCQHNQFQKKARLAMEKVDVTRCRNLQDTSNLRCKIR